MKEARFYNIEEEKIRCNLCPHECLIRDGNLGICGVRKVSSINGSLKLYTLNYGKLTAMAIDPIEKKPLYEFYSGSNILSIGSFGCNFKCSFCQNYEISQNTPNSKEISVEELCDIVSNTKNNIGIAFTYNEPSIWYEFVYDTSKKLKEINPEKKVILVTNGYINKQPLEKLLRFVDAINIDLKGDESYYNRLCGGRLKYVKESIRIAKKAGVHIEVTTLLVSGENTNTEFIEELGEFIKSVDEEIPIHLSRYFPKYKMKNDMTSLNDMKECYKTLRTKVKKIYLGNLTEEEKNYIKDTK